MDRVSLNEARRAIKLLRAPLDEERLLVIEPSLNLTMGIIQPMSRLYLPKEVETNTYFAYLSKRAGEKIMKLHELRSLTILEISRRIRAGSTSPLEIVRLLLSQIHRAEHKMKGYVTVCEDSAVGLAEAAECDRGIVALK